MARYPGAQKLRLNTIINQVRSCGHDGHERRPQLSGKSEATYSKEGSPDVKNLDPRELAKARHCVPLRHLLLFNAIIVF